MSLILFCLYNTNRVTLSLLGFVILAASAHELWLLYNDRTIEPNKDRLALKALHCFSLVTNGRRLLSTKSAAAENISCLNGIRVLSTTWIVIYHTYFQAITHEMYNTFTFLEASLLGGIRINNNCNILNESCRKPPDGDCMEY